MIDRFLSPDAPFVQPLGIEHITYLLFCMAIIFLFIKNKEWVILNKNKVKKIFLISLSIQQLFLLYGWYAIYTPNFWSQGLPLQLCRVASVLTILFLITESNSILNVLNYFSIFALISLFYPLEVYNFTHISGVSYMINHLITVLIPIFSVIAFGWNVSLKSCKHAIIGFSCYLPMALVANYITGGNYFYQTNRPFLHELSSDQFAIITYVVTVLVFIIITKLTINIREYYKSRKSELEYNLSK